MTKPTPTSQKTKTSDLKLVQEKMQTVMDALVAQNEEHGLQLCVYWGGECIVDAWAGTADAGRKVDGETLFPVFSVTKGITATLVHSLVAEGRLSYDTRIADVWPEFAAHGKSNITLRQALCHRAGMPLMPSGLDFKKLYNWESICAAIAAMPPVIGPDLVTIYHSVTFGWILGETMRRVTGLTVGELLESRIKRPLGIEDFYIGLPAHLAPRVAVLEEIFEPGKEPPPKDDPTPRDIPGWLQPISWWMNQRDAQRACMPGVSGIGSARAIARIYAAQLPGGVDGQQILPSHVIPKMTRSQTDFLFPGREVPARISLGYFLGGAGSPEMGPDLGSFGHGGYGGALGYANPACGLAVGLTKNFFTPAASHQNLLRELRRALGVD